MKLKSLMLITLSLFSLESFARTYKVKCEASTVKCELNGRYIIGESCQCEKNGKGVAGKITSVSSDNELTAGIFKSSKIVGEYLCNEKFGDFNFEREYGTLFSNTYLNSKVGPAISKISSEVKIQMENVCKKEHSLVGWGVQGCYDSCYKSFKKEDEFREQCNATCTSLTAKANSLVEDVTALLDSNKLNADSCEKSVRVNESGRDKVKKSTERSGAVPASTTTNGQNKQLNKTLEELCFQKDAITSDHVQGIAQTENVSSKLNVQSWTISREGQ